MFQSWRLKLREAEEALRAGRLDDARQLLSDSDLKQYLPGQRLTEKLVQGVVERALRKGLAGDPLAGWGDLESIRILAGDGTAYLKARDELFCLFVAEVESRLAADDACGALTVLDRLERKQITAKPLKVLRDVARRLESARNLSRRGKFSEADEQLQSAVALRPDLAFIEERRAAARGKLESSRPLLEELHRTMAKPDWSRALTLADQLLEIAPEHAVAQEARRRAWAEVNARCDQSRTHLTAYNRPSGWSERPFSPVVFPNAGRDAPLVSFQNPPWQLDLLAPREATGGDPSPARPAPPVNGGPPRQFIEPLRTGAAAPAGERHDEAAAPVPAGGEAAAVLPTSIDPRLLLWVDGVGGYLVCLNDDILVGQAAPATTADLPILGDLSRRHAWIRRQGERYLVEPCPLARPSGQARLPGQESLPSVTALRINGRLVTEPTLLYDGDELELGAGVKLRFAQPHVLSATARLDFVSRHRPQLRVDGVLLMAESCVLGPNLRNHVVCRDWKDDVVLYRHGGRLFCRAMDDIEIDGRLCEGRGELTGQSVVKGEDFSLALEGVRQL